MTLHIPNFEPMHPKDFRRKHGLSRYQVFLKTKIPLNTLKNWFADESSESYREPTEAAKLYFGLLDALESSPLNTPPNYMCSEVNKFS